MSGSNRVIKHTVLSSGLQDAHIRPPALMNEFRRLSLRDAAAFFSGPDALESVACPGCGGDAPEPAFEKHGFAYVGCAACGSLYVSPRPRAALLARYFAESEASRYRVARLTEGTAPQRRRHQLRGNAAWMGRMVLERHSAARPSYGDLRTYSPLIFDEVADLDCFGDLYSIDPLAPPPHFGNVTVRSVRMEDAPPLDVMSAFEKLEHQHDPLAWLRALHGHLPPGGLLFLTTRTCSGFDLQVLWERAPYIFVPEHLNLLSLGGLEQLLQRGGLELVELSTPGQLDVEQVRLACAADPAIPLPRFVETLLSGRGEAAREDFQEFLQKHRLSSHVRLAARKPT